MDPQIKDVLTLLDEAAHKRWSIREEQFKMYKIDTTAVAQAQQMGFIHWTGANYILTATGHEKLLQYESVDSLREIRKHLRVDKKGVIFDSNAYDKILEGALTKSDIELSRHKGFDYYITHIQADEVVRCPEVDRRQRLTLAMLTLKPIVIPTDSTVAGVSRVGFSRLSDGQDMESIRNGSQRHTNDALIGETAIKNKLILVTEDDRLRTKVKDAKGIAMTIAEFKNEIEKE
ncbi:MAG: hypothetical protein V1776_03790 [Candidatus Diapherotrites archaeon]